MKTTTIVSPIYLATRRDCAIAAKRAGDIGALMREFASVGLRLGREKMFKFAHEVNRLAKVN